MWNRAFGPLETFPISGAPVGHYCYAYDEATQQKRKQYGAKVFFFREQLLNDSKFRLETRLYTDYAWIRRSDVGDYFDKETAVFMDALLLE